MISYTTRIMNGNAIHINWANLVTTVIQGHSSPQWPKRRSPQTGNHSSNFLSCLLLWYIYTRDMHYTFASTAMATLHKFFYNRML